MRSRTNELTVTLFRSPISRLRLSVRLSHRRLTTAADARRTFRAAAAAAAALNAGARDARIP